MHACMISPLFFRGEAGRGGFSVMISGAMTSCPMASALHCITGISM